MKKIIIILFATINVFAQGKDPNTILERVITKFNTVHDYKVDVNVKLDVDFLKVPETKAKIYFKQPDKTHFDSDGFAMLPKQVFNVSPSRLLAFDYTAIYMRSEELDHSVVDVIKIIPNSDSTNMLLSTLWIDTEMGVVRKVEAATKSAGTVSTELSYDNKFEYPLPAEIIVTFKVNNVNLPAARDQSVVNDQHNFRQGRKLEGSVTLTYQNYVVNKGIPDDVFAEQESTKIN